MNPTTTENILICLRLMTRTLTLVMIVVFPIISHPLWCQPAEEHTLHIPPKLDVEISTSADVVRRVLGMEKIARSLGQEADGIKTSNSISVKKRGTMVSTPLLPMIFFDQASPTIPDRYQVFSKKSETHKYADTSEIISARKRWEDESTPKYYELLNIIGYRMAKHPKTTIRLEGGYSTEPGEDAEVGMDRAREVWYYLTTMWHIDTSRIQVLAPRQMCDSSDNILVQEEGRRVIIHSDNWELLRPVSHYQAYYVMPPLTLIIDIDPWMQGDEVSEIELVIAKGEEILSRTTTAGNPDSTHYHFMGVWTLPRMIPYLLEGISVQAIVKSWSGAHRASNVVSIPITIVDDRRSLYGDVSSVDTYDGDIMFFESSDTGLSPYQLNLLKHKSKSIEEKIQHTSTGQWEVRVVAMGEISEYSDIDDAILITRQSEARHKNTVLLNLRNDESFQSPLYLVSEYPEQIEIDRLSTDFGLSVNDYFGDITKKLYNAWYGDRAEEVYQARVPIARESNAIPLSEESQMQFDSLLYRRALSVKRHLEASLDLQSIDTIITGHPQPTDFRSRSIEYQPERRFYQRLSRISISSPIKLEEEVRRKETSE